MEEIRFSGKKIEDGGWIQGYYVKLYDARHDKTIHCIYPGRTESDCGELFPDWYEVDPKSVVFSGHMD